MIKSWSLSWKPFWFLTEFFHYCFLILEENLHSLRKKNMIEKCWIRISYLDNDSPQNKTQNPIIKQKKVFSTIFPLWWTFLCVAFASKDFNIQKVILASLSENENMSREKNLYQGFLSNNVSKIDRIYKRLKCVWKIFTENRIFDYKKKIEMMIETLWCVLQC